VTAVQARKSPLLGFFLPRALSTSGAPFAAGRVGLPRRVVRRVEVARPPPVPSSGFLPLSTVLAALAARAGSCRSPSSAVTPRRFAALFHAARAPGVALQSFPFSRSRTRSRGPRASVRVRVRPPTGATVPSGSRPLSPARRPLARARPADPCGTVERGSTARPGRRFPGVARCRAGTLARSARRRSRFGRARLNGSRHARFEALLSSRVRSRDDVRSGQSPVVPVGALLGFFPSSVCSSNPRVRSAR